MASGVREAIENNERLARSIQHFMWEGKPHKSAKKEHTIDEFESFLEGIRKEAWSSYDSGARELGWKD